MALGAGDKIDRYTIVRPLGAGGMGEVYLAHDERLERDVALKVLPADDAAEASSDGHARLLREARAAAALEHPNVVAVYDVAEASAPEAARGTTYLTMELVDGVPLRDYVGDASVPIERRVAWLASIARALDAAHRRGLVHRDVKPGNVMIRVDGAVKVLDFGIARRRPAAVSPQAVTEKGDATATGAALAGTPPYMAPEQLRREPIDGRCDQFAWGVTAFELLAGRRPWPSEGDALHLVADVLSYEPPRLTEIDPRIPAHVADTVARALAKSPAARFDAMSDVVAKLEGAPRGGTRRVAIGVAGVGVAAAIAIAVALALATGVARRGGVAPEIAGDAAARGTACATHAACVDAHGGAAWTCRDGACAPLAAPGCEVLAAPADLRDEATVWVGAMTGGDGPTRNAIELARRDFASLPRTLGAAGGRRRPLAVVACDDAREPRKALGHLLDDVGAPAVVGFYSSEEAVELLSDELVPRGVLTVVASNPASQITAIRTPADRPRLIWRTTNDTTQMASVVSAFIEQVLEPRRRAGRAGPVKVALVRARTVTGVGFSDALVSSLRINGASVAGDPDHFAEHVFDADVAAGDPALGDARRELATMAPDVVVYFGAELFDLVVRPLEKSWPRGAPRPAYVSGLPFDADVLRTLDDDALRRRMFAVTTPANTAANAKFTLHYNATFADKVTPASSPNTAYDAVYVLGYALSALGDRPVDGAALGGAIARLTRGPLVEVGPAKLLDGVGALVAGDDIDLVGSAGALDFDLATGSSRPDHVVLCVGRGPDGAAVGVESGLTWAAKTQTMRGALACP